MSEALSDVEKIKQSKGTGRVVIECLSNKVVLEQSSKGGS